LFQFTVIMLLPHEREKLVPTLSLFPVFGVAGKRWLLPPHSKAAFAAP
jgi:hypothetical protein